MSTESPRGETGQEDVVMQGGLHSVRRVGDQIERPAGAHTATVHRLLRHLREHEFDGAPDPISLDATNETAPTEVVSFVEGEVTGSPMSMSFRTDDALISAAILLRKMHDASVGFERVDADVWDLPPQEPAEVICHGDFAPYNCALNLGVISGVFDFDTAHPGPRLWDLGYAAYRWAPLLASTNPERFGDVNENWRRLRLFVDSYFDENDGSAADRASNPVPVYRGVIQAAIDRLIALVELMRTRADEGHAGFAAHIEAGHDALYLADIEHLRFLLR